MVTVATKGRPRRAVASLDAEATERRRTQLRVAQRAFRKRREATTEELREQVNELQSLHNSLLASLRDILKDPTVKENDGVLAGTLEGLVAKYTASQYKDEGAKARAASPAAQQHGGKAQIPVATADSALSMTSAASHTSSSSASNKGGTTADIGTSCAADILHLADSLPVNLFWNLPTELELLQPLQPFGYDEAPFSIRLRRRGIQAGYQ